ncbi:McrB family protein [Natrinema salsiterrestre]|uniref:AAA family ATPase n=1 Tax=Natrinema salsiterrestre TaxID=2950540 RepID=A0A9Q4L6L0_9EURY|nr:AAA family ATPase [Natrinema salsiterrestre]MDF9748219.1 AAA family ATPase [Natrinema salsiterrestre]
MEKPSRADEIARQLESSKQAVFYGPPGTGKTYIAKRFAEWWVQERTDTEPIDEQIQTVTFHPSFAYEDFMEGLTATANNGNVTYEVEEGVFKRVTATARAAYLRARQNDESPPPYVLIIDEINRGNLAQIFGETITQLEADKRLDEENETAVQLAHSGESFVIPPNLYLIGTMNTADRSIALVDAALRRRFRFLAFPPTFDDVIAAYDLPDDPLQDGDAFEALLSLSVQSLRELNDRITTIADLGKGKQIGHARLFGLTTTQEIRDAWRYDILPLLEEYYFGQFDRIRQELFDGSGDELFDWDRKQIRDFTEQELADALSNLVGDDVELSYSAADSDTDPSTDSRKQWDEESFFDELESEYDPEIVAVYKDLYDFAEKEADETDYGTGVRTGAMQFYWDEFNDGDYLVFESRTNGTVQFRFWGRSQYDDYVFENFAENIASVLEDPIDAKYMLSEEFEDLEIPAERLIDDDAREQFKNTVREFVNDCAAMTQ